MECQRLARERGSRLDVVIGEEVTTRSGHLLGLFLQTRLKRNQRLEITVAEGRTREVRRLCEALGLGVERLVRTQFGPVRLGDLPPGATRALTGRERDLIASIVQ